MVSVGEETLPRRMSGRPAMRLSFSVVVSTSLLGSAAAPGGPLGQIGKLGCPGTGSQAGFCAKRVNGRLTIAAKRSRRLCMMQGPRNDEFRNAHHHSEKLRECNSSPVSKRK